jgi:hypothetical protein
LGGLPLLGFRTGALTLGFKSKNTDSRERARRAALNALKRAKRAADRTQTKLSEWEGEFLGSVEERVKRYGCAFRDPEKGELSASLSLRQAVKLKEIGAKASGKTKPAPGLSRRAVRITGSQRKTRRNQSA